MTLTRGLMLVRHAQATAALPDHSDFARPLSHRGRKEAECMARFVADRFDSTSVLLVSSPALRALTTAQIFAKHLGQSRNAVLLAASLYEASVGDWHAVVCGLESKAMRVIAFGHNPGISEFLGWLCQKPEGRRDMPTAAMATLRLEANRWATLQPGGAHLEHWTTPQLLDS